MRLPMIRLLYRECDSTRGLKESPVGPDGRFNVPVTIPLDSPPGPHDILVVGAGSSDPSVALNPPIGEGSVSIFLAPGTISGHVKIQFSNGTTQPVANFAMTLVGTNKSLSQVFFDPLGMYSFSNLSPDTYQLFPAFAGVVFQQKTVTLLSGNHLVVDFVGKYASAALEQCQLWSQLNEPNERIPVLASIGKSHGPDIGVFASLPGKGLPLVNEFTAFIPFDIKGATVKIAFLGAGSKELTATLKQQKSKCIKCGSLTEANVTVDMSEFSPGKHQVQVIVEDGGVRCTLEPSLEFTMVSVPWFNPWITNSSVKIQTKPVRYEFTGILPKPAFDFNQPLNLGFATLDNIVTLGIPIKETLYLDGTWTGQAAATARVTFLSLDLLNKMASYTPSGNPYATRAYAFKLPTVHSSLLNFTTTIFTFGFGIPKILYIGVTISFHLEAFIEVDSTIKKDLKVNVIVSPGGTVGLPISAEIDLLICGGEAGVTPSVTLKLPIYYDVDCNPDFGFLDPCLRIDATLFYKISCFWIEVASGSESFNLYQTGCGPPSGCNPSSQITSGQAAMSLPGSPVGTFTPPASSQAQNPEAPLAPRPSVASDGGGHALAVWLDDPNPAVLADRQFYYSFYDGARWSPPQRLNNEDALVDHARVAFLGPNRALAVWMQNKLNHEQAHQADASTLMQNSELYYALWNGRTWGPSAPITVNDHVDAFPSVAGDPTTGQAIVVWVRTDQFVGFDAPPLTEIDYASFDGTQWSQPTRLAPRGRAIDYQPTVQFDRRGQAVAVWLRDEDGDLTTHQDRQIVLSRFDGRAWSAPEAISTLPAGAQNPSLAFDKDNNPIVVFLVPPIDPNTGQPGSGNGTNSQLYAAYLRGAAWEVTSVDQETFAERPIVRVNPDNRAIIVYRQFGTFGVHRSGDLAVAVADLNAPRLRWTTGFLTADGLTNWQVAFDVDSKTSQNFVLNVKEMPGRTAEARSQAAEALAHLPKGNSVGGRVSVRALDGRREANTAPAQNQSIMTRAEERSDITVASYVVPYAVDLALTPEDVAFSSTHALVGDTVTISAAVRNAGLKATSDRTPFTVRFYEGDPATGTLIGQQQVEQPLLFNTTMSVAVPYTISHPGVQTITIVVDEENAIAESDETNNKVQVTFGQTPAPIQLFANPDAGKKVITLGWTAPDTPGIDYYLIFRSLTAGTNYELVGETTRTNFVDTLVQPGVTYYYVVIAVDVYGTRSGLSNEASGQLSQ